MKFIEIQDVIINTDNITAVTINIDEHYSCECKYYLIVHFKKTVNGCLSRSFSYENVEQVDKVYASLIYILDVRRVVKF